MFWVQLLSKQSQSSAPCCLLINIQLHWTSWELDRLWGPWRTVTRELHNLLPSGWFHPFPPSAHPSSFHILQTGRASSVATLSWATLQGAYVTLSPSLFWLLLSNSRCARNACTLQPLGTFSFSLHKHYLMYPCPESVLGRSPSSLRSRCWLAFGLFSPLKSNKINLDFCFIEASLLLLVLPLAPLIFTIPLRDRVVSSWDNWGVKR